MKEEVADFLSLPAVKWSLIGIVTLLVALLIFHAGLVVGERHALPPGGFDRMQAPAPFGFLPHSFIEGGHGVVGTIVSFALPTTTILTRDGASEQVVLTQKTQIREGGQTLGLGDLTVGEQVIVIGEPNNGEEASRAVNALLVRVLPSASTTSQTIISHMPMQH